MKNNIVGFLLVFISLSTVNAQDVRFGIKGGVNIANVAGSESNTNAVTSFHIGGVMEAKYSDKIALQPEILYSEQGFESDNIDAKETYKLTYVIVPVMLKYFVSENLILEAGPQIGFLNTAKILSETNEGSETMDIKEALRSNDLSLNLGAGFQLKNGWNIGARYNWGVSNLVKREVDKKFQNSVIQVSVGYLF